MSSDDPFQLIADRLEIIIKLLAVGVVKGKDVRDQVLTLHDMGISNKEIASILGKSQNTVNVTLSQARRANRNVK
jgi:hypothetical protein